MASSSVDIVCPPNEAGVKAEADDSWESPGTELGTEQALKAHPSPQRLQPKEQTLPLGQGLGGLHTSWMRVFSHSCFLSDRGGKAWEACILPRGTVIGHSHLAWSVLDATFPQRPIFPGQRPVVSWGEVSMAQPSGALLEGRNQA